MKRLLVAAAVQMLLLARFTDGCAAGDAGQFDGKWAGSATSTVRRCDPAKATVTVEGTMVLGQARFPNEASNIAGTVRVDGSFGATIGWQPLKGKFSGDVFDGTFKNGDCEWEMHLQRVQ
jgi:hypothetical protein